ncbi:MAG: NADH-quinone oxidoreductase subunit NuoE [Alphaproteobacteria bacterium]|jgi:NADH-quinone oxidoreductase subunit E|nr:NADH-quinone oxidoreductase subunit NuoE [Alphaproteobacteria bacterium]
MSGRHFAPDSEQPDSFVFSDETMALAEAVIAKYPPGRQQSACIPLLDLAQRQHGWLPKAAIRAVAELLKMPEVRAFEVATFYTMFNIAPVGKHLVQVCRTTPCWLRGSDDLTNACRKHLDVELGETSADGEFTLVEVECLGACVNAPMVQINDDYYEDLDAERMVGLLDDLKAGKPVSIGSQEPERETSAPIGGRTTLLAGDEA